MQGISPTDRGRGDVAAVEHSLAVPRERQWSRAQRPNAQDSAAPRASSPQTKIQIGLRDGASSRERYFSQ